MIPQEDYIIRELGLSHLPTEEQQAVTASIRDHMQEVLIATTLENMSDEQLAAVGAEIKKDAFDEERIMRITAGIPHIHQKIQTALTDEWDIIKTSYEKIK